jgi:hypothetical protein
MDWGCSSSGRVPALQVPSPKFKSQSCIKILVYKSCTPTLTQSSQQSLEWRLFIRPPSSLHTPGDWVITAFWHPNRLLRAQWPGPVAGRRAKATAGESAPSLVMSFLISTHFQLNALQLLKCGNAEGDGPGFLGVSQALRLCSCQVTNFARNGERERIQKNSYYKCAAC